MSFTSIPFSPVSSKTVVEKTTFAAICRVLPDNSGRAVPLKPLPWHTNKIRYNFGLLSVKARICPVLPRVFESILQTHFLS